MPIFINNIPATMENVNNLKPLVLAGKITLTACTNKDGMFFTVKAVQND